MLRANDVLVATMALVVAPVWLGACEFAKGPPENELFDVPVEGLSPTQMDLHLAGDEEFGRVFTPQSGLGPVYNAASCDTCHPGEAKGHPTFNLTRFGAQTKDGFSPMRHLGGPQLQDRSIPGYPAETVPEDATAVAEFTAPAITGLGYLEVVDDATLLEMADPKDEDGDGISGRVQLIEETETVANIVKSSRRGGDTDPDRLQRHDGKYIGRFGKKAKAVNLLHQTVGAYTNDMGITTPLTPDDLTNVAGVGPASQDKAPDPVVPTSTVSNVVFYLKTLRPPERRNADDPDVKAGEKIFSDVGCADCHVPTLKTGDSRISQLSNTKFHPYTDLLLHDMGSELNDGYAEGRANPGEWRTPPLWGLGLAANFQGGKPHLLHDGRATSIREAIELHGGEGAASRNAFGELSGGERKKLLKFLKSL